MPNAAYIAFDGACRLIWEHRAGDAPRNARTAGWLMCNPSTADALQHDQTTRRVVHHSERVGCPRQLVGNVWSLRTPYPDNLWPRLRSGEYTGDMWSANLDALAAIGAQSDVLFVAFGAEPWRNHRQAVLEALNAFLPLDDGHPPLCLGMTRDGAPLHPLARGKLAVRNDCVPYDWPGLC